MVLDWLWLVGRLSVTDVIETVVSVVVDLEVNAGSLDVAVEEDDKQDCGGREIL